MQILIILIILIALSAIFSGTEIALFSLSQIKVKSLTKRKIKNSHLVAKLKQNPDRLLIIILIGNNLVNIAAAALATALAIKFFGSIGVGIATGAMTLLILIFGEIIPKSFATTHAERISLSVAKPLWFLSYILSPIITLFEYITKFFTKRWGKISKKPSISEDELKIMTRIGVEEGSVEKHEEKIIRNVFLLNDITAENVMTAKSKMFTLDAKNKIKDSLKDIIECRYSRIPVYENKPDDIIGILYVKDVLHEIARDNRNITLKEIAKKPLFIPRSKVLDDLLPYFQRQHVHIAIVLNEYGEVIGLVTLEDLLEELVGEIIDETDIDKRLIRRLGKNAILVDGETEMRDINDFFNTEIPGSQNNAISRFILDELGEIPKQGREMRVDSLRLIIEDADEKKIKKVKIVKE